MSHLSIRQIVHAQFSHQETDFIPYTLAFEKPAAEKLTEFYGSTAWKHEIIDAVNLVADFDSWGTIVHYDPNLPEKGRDVYGNEWTQTDDISHLDKPGLQGIAYKDYRWPTIEDFYPPEKRRKTLLHCEEVSKSGKYVVANEGAGPYELSWRLLGVENALIASIADEDLYDDIIEHLAVLIDQFIDECVQLPIDAVMISDDWCDQRSCIMGVERWRKYFKPRYSRFYDRIHKAGKKTITHVCGNVSPLIPDLIEIGLDVLESVQPEPAGMNPYKLKELYGDKIAFWGGLGCQSIVTFGSPDDLRTEIRKLRHEMSRGGGYILQPAKTINKTVPVENLVAIYETFIEENNRLW